MQKQATRAFLTTSPIRRRLVAAIALMAAGCTPYAMNVGGEHFVVPRAEYAQLKAAPVCCATFADMRFARLPLGTSFGVTLGPGSPAFEFEGGKSYFAAFEVPMNESALNVTIAMYLQPGIFHPSILVLDETFKATRPIERDVLRALHRVGDRVVVDGTVRIDPVTGRERYLVILASSDAMDSPVSSPLGRQAPPGLRVLPGISPVSYWLRDTYYFGPTGSITVRALAGQ